MYKTLKTQIFPNKEQIRYFERCFGFYRFVYNWGLEKYLDGDRKDFSRYKYNKEFNHTIEKDPEYYWVNLFNKSIKQEALSDLELAITLSKKLKGKRSFGNYKLHFRKKGKINKSFRMHRKDWRNFLIYGKNRIKINISTEFQKVYSKKLFIVKTAEDISFINSNDIKNVIISERNKKYYIHIVYYTEQKHRYYKHKKHKIGIDLGYKNPIVSYDGNKIKDNYGFPFEKILYLERRCDYYQSKLSHQRGPRYDTKGRFRKPSNRYERTRLKLNKTYLKIYNIRKDWREKVTTKLVKKYEIIKLDVPLFRISKYKDINKSMYRIGIYELVLRFQQKAIDYRTRIDIIPEGIKSTNICSCCGHENIVKLNLTDRVFRCEECGHIEDRDINSSKIIYNIKKQLKISFKKSKKNNKKNNIKSYNKNSTLGNRGDKKIRKHVVTIVRKK